MASSRHAFLYGSLDAAGLMTVDKPPFALWVQALTVRVFGLHSLSLLVPQALMGVASVALVYDLVRRRWGRAGGFAAGAALALTPITVAISRHNNPTTASAASTARRAGHLPSVLHLRARPVHGGAGRRDGRARRDAPGALALDRRGGERRRTPRGGRDERPPLHFPTAPSSTA
jgi:hypothetical protein